MKTCPRTNEEPLPRTSGKTLEHPWRTSRGQRPIRKTPCPHLELRRIPPLCRAPTRVDLLQQSPQMASTPPLRISFKKSSALPSQTYGGRRIVLAAPALGLAHGKGSQRRRGAPQLLAQVVQLIKDHLECGPTRIRRRKRTCATVLCAIVHDIVFMSAHTCTCRTSRQGSGASTRRQGPCILVAPPGAMLGACHPSQSSAPAVPVARPGTASHM